MIPLLHDFTDARVLIFGGGPVGARRARTFSREARVIVLSPTFVDESFGSATRIRAAPGVSDVADWFDRVEPCLVVVATDEEKLNDAIAGAAHRKGVLVNRADRSGSLDALSVAVPATVREDPVVVSIGTGGTSPALSRRLREEIEAEIEGVGELARLTGTLREQAQLQELDPEKRRELLRTIVQSDCVWKALGDDGPNLQSVVSELVASELGETKWG